MRGRSPVHLPRRLDLAADDPLRRCQYSHNLLACHTHHTAANVTEAPAVSTKTIT